MNTYHAVTTTVGEHGCFIKYAGEVQAETKPENSVKSTARADYYMDYFDTEEEAEEFIAENEDNRP